MKRECCYINSTDIFLSYGAFVSKEGYNQLFSFPAVKPVATNDWMEEDGIEADLSTLYKSPREVEIAFNLIGTHDWRGFVNFLIAGKRLDIQPVECCQWHFYLRYLSVSGFEPQENGITKLTVRFAEDVPWGAAGSGPNTVLPYVGGADDYKLDEVAFGAYGVMVVKGTHKSVAAPAELKRFLLRSFANADGQVYDNGATPKKAGKTFQLQCILIAKGGTYNGQAMTPKEVFWWLYAKLYRDLVAANANVSDVTTTYMRRVYDGADGNTVTCHYSNSAIQNLFTDEGRWWCRFTIDFTEVNNGA